MYVVVPEGAREVRPSLVQLGGVGRPHQGPHQAYDVAELLEST